MRGATWPGPALVEVLDSHDSELRVAALDALATKQAPLHNPAALWHLVCNEEIDPVERARACYCLERTKSIDPATVLEKLHNLHPYVRYFAARCLIAAGERKGIGVLLDLLRSDEQRFVGKDLSKLASLRAESRKLLKYLSRSWISDGEKEWREWFKRLADLRPHVLPPPIASATVSAKPVRPSPLR